MKTFYLKLLTIIVVLVGIYLSLTYYLIPIPYILLRIYTN